ncbi:hypothetical protein B0J12DRAFT_255562 [Macrophomina phaseolina]|uniref:Secreted protein n=1 Tax=Macrophomina phaseolina TaxID=35725 RepID=A0ABQ8G0A6_9PEZI|nr:hypothetical protein B0J12DRAFT_255562 [Macrophomina phaseolina]
MVVGTAAVVLQQLLLGPILFYGDCSSHALGLSLTQRSVRSDCRTSVLRQLSSCIRALLREFSHPSGQQCRGCAICRGSSPGLLD